MSSSSLTRRWRRWLRCHRNAFSYFGGVPERVVIDNLKAAIIRACWDDPQVQQAYRECAEHYGFLIAPCRPYTPQHKGKVEQGGVHYVKRNFLGGRTVTLHRSGQPGRAGLVRHDRRSASSRNDQGATAAPFSASRARAVAATTRTRPTTWPSGKWPSCTGIAT